MIVKMITMIKPTTRELQRLKIQKLVEAYNSHFIPIREAGADALAYIMARERDPFTQKLLLSSKYDLGHTHYGRETLLNAVIALRPANLEVANLKMEDLLFIRRKYSNSDMNATIDLELKKLSNPSDVIGRSSLADTLLLKDPYAERFTEAMTCSEAFSP